MKYRRVVVTHFGAPEVLQVVEESLHQPEPGEVRVQIASYLIPDGKKIVLYSIQTLKRRKPAWFREDMATLFGLLSERKIKPVIAARIPLTEAVHAHELVGGGSVIGRIVLVCE